jgi:hypothetical protein
MKDPASHYFTCTDAERAVFEAGIKLGTIYHQFIGAPVNRSNVKSLERTIEDGAKVQPFVKKVSVCIDRKALGRGSGVYSYKTLTGSMLRVRLTLSYNGVEAECEMRTVPEINYPLMYIKRIGNSPGITARKMSGKVKRQEKGD